MAAFDDLLCNDEDVAIRAAGDFAQLIPAHQRAAYGTDGTLTAWTLTTTASLTGLVSGHVVYLERPSTPWADLLAVSSKAGGVVTLRRIGMISGDGPPPTPPSGTTAVTFYAPTARPQIASATRTILRKFGLASYDAIAGTTRADGTTPGDAEDFRDLATLDVLISLLWTQHRAGVSEENFHTKYRDLIEERARLFGELIDEYGVTTAAPLRPGVMTFPTYRPSNTSEFGA